MDDEPEDLLRTSFLGAMFELVHGRGPLLERLRDAFAHLRQAERLLQAAREESERPADETDRPHTLPAHLLNVAWLLEQESLVASMAEEEQSQLAGTIWEMHSDIEKNDCYRIGERHGTQATRMRLPALVPEN
jgi:ATP phosphoribosyltransferase regulatory subunit HisZ